MICLGVGGGCNERIVDGSGRALGVDGEGEYLELR